MDSSFGRDPAEYWITITYNNGTTETLENLRLNEAYERACELENLKKRQDTHWYAYQAKPHIVHIEAGRKVENTRRSA